MHFRNINCIPVVHCLTCEKIRNFGVTQIRVLIPTLPFGHVVPLSQASVYTCHAPLLLFLHVGLVQHLLLSSSLLLSLILLEWRETVLSFELMRTRERSEMVLPQSFLNSCFLSDRGCTSLCSGFSQLQILIVNEMN